MYKKGTKYKVMKPMKAKGESDKKERLYVFEEIFEGNPSTVEHPASLEEVKEEKEIKNNKKPKRGEKDGSHKI